MHPRRFCEGKLHKGAMDSASTSLWMKAASPVCTRIPDNSVPPVGPWSLSSCWSRAGAQSHCVQGSLRIGALTRMLGTSAASVHLVTISTGSIARSNRNFSSWQWNGGWGIWHWTGTPGFSRRTSAVKIILLIFIYQRCGWAQAVQPLHPSYQSQ